MAGVRFRVLSALTLLCLPLCAAAAAAPVATDPVTAANEAVRVALAKDCDKAADIVAQQIARRDMTTVAPSAQIKLYHVGMYCAIEGKRMDLAERYAEAGSKVAGSPFIFWHTRFNLAWVGGRHDQAVSVAEAMAVDRPEALNAMSFPWGSALRALRNEQALHHRLLKTLVEHYVPDEIGMTIDYMLHDYAAILMDAGDRNGAAALMARISSPNYLARVSLDPRLRTIIPANFDARTAVERHMARMRDLAAAHPGLIQPQMNVADDLPLLGKGEEALATLDALHPETSTDSYTDRKDALNWWWNSKAGAFSLLGRYDDAIDAFSQARKLYEFGSPNFSQTINESELQLRFDHPTDALVTLAPIAAGTVHGSPYGMMQFRANHGCASFKTGKREDAAADLVYLQAHQTDAAGALIRLQLCMRDRDGAAATIIRTLDKPDERVVLLLDLSDYDDGPATQPPPQDSAERRAVKARPDVQAALARAGGHRRFNVLPF